MSLEARAGIVAVLFVAAVVGFMLFLRGGVSFRERSYELYVIVPNAGGMTVGSQVQMAGVEVGRVSRLELTSDRRARITLRIRAGIGIPVGSRFAVASSGLLGDRYLAIAPEPGDVPSLDPGTIVTGTAPISLEEVIDRVVALAQRAEDALISINRLLGDPALATGLRATVDNARDATLVMRRTAELIERSARTLDRTLSAEVPAIARQLRLLAADLTETSAEVRTIVRDVSADGQTALQIRQTIASIQRAADGIDKMVSDLQGVINEREVTAVRASLAEARTAISEARTAITDARTAVGEGRAVIARAGTALDRIQRVIPDRLEIPELRNIARLEYGLWYDGARVGQDINLTLQPDAPTNFVFTLRESGGSSRVGAQVGSRLAPGLRLRYGLVDSYLGVGLDYRATPVLSYSADLMNINLITLNLYLRYMVNPEYGITLRALSVLNKPVVGVGVFRRF